jgi:hypothetical protein
MGIVKYFSLKLDMIYAERQTISKHDMASTTLTHICENNGYKTVGNYERTN